MRARLDVPGAGRSPYSLLRCGWLCQPLTSKFLQRIRQIGGDIFHLIRSPPLQLPSLADHSYRTRGGSGRIHATGMTR